MTRNRTICVGMITAALAIAGATSPASAQQVSEARIRELVKQAAERVAAGQAGNPAPQTAAGQAAADSRPTVRLSLDDVVKAALDHNLNIAVQRLNPEIQDISLASIQSIYRPTLTSALGTQSTTNPANSTISGGDIGQSVYTGTTTLNAGIAQSIPRGGGSLTVQFNNSKVTSNSTTTFYTPSLTPTWTAQYTQPVLRNRTIDANRQSIAVTKVNRDISDVQLRATITNTLSNVRTAYWNYVFAVQSVEVARQSVALAGRLVQDNQTRVQVGTMAPLDVVQAQSQQATAQQNLVTAQATMRTNELTLKQLIVSGTEDPVWNSTIDPVDRPDFVAEPIDVAAALRRALNERTDLAIAKKNLEGNDVTVKYLRDQLLPQADVVALFGAQGLGGVPRLATSSGSYGDAFSSLKDNRRWSLTLNLSYPIGLSSAQAVVARARVQQGQDAAQVKVIELQIATDVTNAATNAQSAIERVQAAQAARTLAQRQLDAENSKFEVGMSTNYLVVQSQRDLATAQNNELQAILLYRNSLVELDRLQQTTLGNLGVTVISSATR